MAITVVNVATKTQTGLDPPNLLIAVPAGTLDGQFMLSFIGANAAITPPAGWTTLINQQFNTLFFYVGRRPALSEPADYLWTMVSSNRAGVIMTVKDQDPVLPFVVQANLDTQDTVAPGTQATPGTGPFALTTGMLIRTGFFHNINGGFIQPGATITNPGNHTLRAEPIGNNRTQTVVFTDDVEFTGTNILSETITCNNSGGIQNQHGITVLLQAAVIPIAGIDIIRRRRRLMSKGRHLTVIIANPRETDSSAPGLYLVKDPDGGVGGFGKPPESASDARGDANDGWKAYSYDDVGTAYNL